MEVGTIVSRRADMMEHISWLHKTEYYEEMQDKMENVMADLDLPPRSFNSKWGMDQEKLFSDLKLPCYVYVGSSTRKNGKNRSRLINHLGKKVVVFDEDILCAGKLHIESDNFQRWIPVERMDPENPLLDLVKRENPKWQELFQKHRVIQDKDFGLVGYNSESEDYLRFQMRWAKSLMQIVPDNTKLSAYEDDACFTVGLPAVQRSNGKFYASGVGVGWLLNTTATYDQMGNAHMNKYQQAQDTIKKLNAQQGTYYVPMSYVRTHFRWNGDPYPQAGLAINWPVTGFLHLIKDYSPTEPNFI